MPYVIVVLAVAVVSAVAGVRAIVGVFDVALYALLHTCLRVHESTNSTSFRL